MIAKIYVALKKGVHDPQGEAVQHALAHLGHRDVTNVRMGKYIELKFADTDQERAKTRIVDMCEKLLANTVIESYRFELVES